MKTSMFARAAESEMEDERCAQACGFVSRTTASSDGGGAVSICTWRSEASMEFIVSSSYGARRSARVFMF